LCGIAGIVDFGGSGGVTASELERMAGVLAHRGPDDQGIYLDPDHSICGLAHRRLSIIDIEGGHQPLSNEDESLWITYNGECYNFQELRTNLIAAGHQFRSNSDTEVVVHLYEEYGPKCVDHIRGMFALAIWDSKQRKLFLARDRLGQKPLYYAVHNGRFIFASECKAILQVEEFPRNPDRQSILEYLLLQYVPYPRSGFAQIKQLPPAHTVTINEHNFSNPTPQRYWSIPSEPTFTGDKNQAVEKLREVLAESVQLRMISEVPLGAFLSGGVDSTIIVGLMSGISGQPIRTCSIGFDEELYNELGFARQAADHFGCDHYEQTVRADCADTIEKLSTYYDEPFADCSALPTYHLSHVARSKVTVALSGDGGDECFGGYDRYRALYLVEKIRRSRLLGFLARRKFWHRLAATEHHGRLHRLQRLLSSVDLPASQRYLKWLAVFDPDLIAEIIAPRHPPPSSQTRLAVPPGGLWQTLDSCFTETGNFADNTERLMAQAMRADGMFYLPGDINTKVDRASMSIGLEVRSPFQDHKVVELAYSLPTAWRHDGKLSKILLRQSCADLLPADIARRGKMGFGVPVGRWFRNELRDMFCDTVLSERALQRGYFRRDVIERLFQENKSKRADHGHRLWSLLMLERWHRQYIDNG
jgi:asparagine synthase (glutamine-hydrolysing)